MVGEDESRRRATLSHPFSASNPLSAKRALAVALVGGLHLGGTSRGEEVAGRTPSRADAVAAAPDGGQPDGRREVPLFAGDSLKGWTRPDGSPPSDRWRLSDGVLHLDLSNGRGGHIISERRFEDIDLSFEWKIAAKGNSGLKYRVQRYGRKLLGCEYQLLDDRGYDSVQPKRSAGALYALYAPDKGKQLRPAGEYNSSRIRIVGDRAEHWLNGRKIVDAQIGSDDWDRRVASSKFSEHEGFGRNRSGRLMITDHGSEVWYRGFRLKASPVTESADAAD